MATANNKTPPSLSKAKRYSDWIRFVRLSTKFTHLDPTRQGPALVMTLEGKALDTILELDDSEISDKERVIKIISKLNSLYNKDKLNENTPIQQFLFDFDHVYNELQRHGGTISDDLLSFELLKAAKISGHQE